MYNKINKKQMVMEGPNAENSTPEATDDDICVLFKETKCTAELEKKNKLNLDKKQPHRERTRKKPEEDQLVHAMTGI